MPERHPAVPAVDQPDPHQRSRLDLSPVQVAGGALAAMTAAGLGSRLGAEGTLIGAALASVVAAVAGALYTASLRRTTAVIRGVVGGRRPRPAAAEVRPTPEPSGSTAPPDTGSRTARTSRRRALILSSVVGAVAIFALAGVALTLYEAIAGRALSGGDGTTISQVQQGGSPGRPAEQQPVSPTDSAEPSASAEATRTPDASETPPTEAGPTDQPSPEPSVEPSAEPSATAEAEPSAPAEPPAEAPSENAATPR